MRLRRPRQRPVRHDGWIDHDRSPELEAESPGVPGPDTTQDLFGGTLAAGDFNADGRDELAISADDYIHGSGRVLVLNGSSAGLTTTGVQRWTQGSVHVPGKVEDGDHFGAALYAANFGRSAAEDLAIGVPGESQARGVVDVLYGRASGLGSVNAQGWSQSTTGVKGTAAPEDIFGGFPPVAPRPAPTEATRRGPLRAG